MRGLLCKHSVVLEDSVGPNGPVRLPNGSPDEPALDQTPIELHLYPEELDSFRHPECLAATHFGPLDQDKQQNEDFALAGVVNERAFGIVADGVSTKNFWPARASRIAAFAAYDAVKRHTEMREPDKWPLERTDEDIDPFLDDLCRTLEERFDEDRAALIKAGARPHAWDPALYDRYAGNDETSKGLWYKTTLLLVVLGPKAGWFVFCGDGGAVRLLAEPGQSQPRWLEDGRKPVLETAADMLEIDAAVGFGVTRLQFKRGFIGPAEGGRALHFILASDGVDRSLANRRARQPDSAAGAPDTAEPDANSPEKERTADIVDDSTDRVNAADHAQAAALSADPRDASRASPGKGEGITGPLDYPELDLSSPSKARAALEQIAEWRAEQDNLSIARVCWPPEAKWPMPKPAVEPEQEGGADAPDGDARSAPPQRSRTARALAAGAALIAAFLLGSAVTLVGVAVGPGQSTLSAVRSWILQSRVSPGQELFTDGMTEPDALRASQRGAVIPQLGSAAENAPGSNILGPALRGTDNAVPSTPVVTGTPAGDHASGAESDGAGVSVGKPTNGTSDPTARP